MFLPDHGPLRETVIPENTDISSNNNTESIDSVLIYLHISGKKYRIFSRKTDTATNITLHKMTERIQNNTILEVTDDKGVIH